MFHRMDGFSLQSIGNDLYLLPFGQPIADQKRGLLLNETGAFLWHALKEPQNLETLVELLTEHYALSEEDLPELRCDVLAYLSEMKRLRYIKEEDEKADAAALLVSPLAKTLSCSIGGLSVILRGETSVVEDFFCDFSFHKGDTEVPADKTAPLEDETRPFQEILLVAHRPFEVPNGHVLLRNEHLIVMETKNGYVLLYPDLSSVLEAHLTHDGSRMEIYYRSSLPKTDYEQVFFAIRTGFLYFAQQHGRFSIHSASLLYQEKAWVFSGPSGMGKSTHTNLWKDLCDTPVLNGDLNLLGYKDGQPVVYGLPWCGTSGITTAKTYPLGGIILLERGPNDAVTLPNPSERVLRVLQRLTSPTWTKSLLQNNLDFVLRLTSDIPVFALACTKEPSAVWAIKNEIDHMEASLYEK